MTPILSSMARRPPTAQRAETIPSQLISFAIGEDQYGVDIMAVREIKGWTDITPLPRQPQYVRGVLNLRGSSSRSSTCAAASGRA